MEFRVWDSGFRVYGSVRVKAAHIHVFHHGTQHGLWLDFVLHVVHFFLFMWLKVGFLNGSIAIGR